MPPDDEDLAELLLPDDVVDSLPNTPRLPRLPRHEGLWAAVTLKELMDRRRDGTYSARTRLLLYLRIKSRRGQRPVVLRNAMAKEIGLDRHQKRVCLHYLEAEGDISVERVGHQNPIITVHQHPTEETL
jgi:hypothetical protein